MKGHWQRLLVQFLILVSMLVVNFIDPDLYLGMIGISVLILCSASWTVFAMLLWTSRQAPEIQSLHERVDDALTLALISTVAAAIGGVVVLRVLGFTSIMLGSLITVGLGFIVVEISLPALGFLRTWRNVYLPMVRRRRDETNMGFTHMANEDDPPTT